MGIHCRIEANGIPRLTVVLQAVKEASPEWTMEWRHQEECLQKGEREGDRLVDMCEHVERR